jgi:dTDP-4-dehydrorhamnose reductase
MKTLITGARGQLATSLARLAPPNFRVQTATRAELDIANPQAVRTYLEAHRPELVINGAAYNAVDRAQSEGASDALQINAHGVTNLALACRDFGARLVHFSTDFVFDGRKNSPYVEADATNPLSVYGASKLCGENVCLSTNDQNLAIRVCRLFGPVPSDEGAGSARKPHGNFPLLMLRLARERGQVRVVDDQIGSPTYTPDLARAVWQLIERAPGGLFQLSNAGEVSFADYAAEVFRFANVQCEIERVSSEEYGAPAKRPAYSTFSNAKAHEAGITPLREWREALREYLESL